MAEKDGAVRRALGLGRADEERDGVTVRVSLATFGPWLRDEHMNINSLPNDIAAGRSPAALQSSSLLCPASVECPSTTSTLGFQYRPSVP